MVIIGQEAICPNGLGRVVLVINRPGGKLITVQLYEGPLGTWPAKDIELIDPRPVTLLSLITFGWTR